MAEARFAKGETVVYRATRELGRVEVDPEMDAGEYWYKVRFSRRVDNVVEEDLDSVDDADESVEELAQHGRWGTLSAFRCALAVERISHQNRSTLYAFKSQRVLFQPHQYKPVLKLLNSVDRRLLIADEVGLGKTIESGLILMELEARSHLERVLVVCPSRLRDKWREELNRKFGQAFDIYDRQALLRYISAMRDNPSRRQLRAVVSLQALRDPGLSEHIEAEIGQFDLVIVDEAHHARNPSTQTSELLRMLGRMSDGMVLLTATPLHLGSRDLFTLLQALKPTEFTDAKVFDSDLEQHRGIHEASQLVRLRDPTRLTTIRDILSRMFAAGDSSEDPRASELIRRLGESPPTEAAEWIELERQIQELHPLSSILTRTKKRDVQEQAPRRRATTFCCEWTAEEDMVYQQLVAGSTERGWVAEKLSLGGIQRARQAASCLPAALARAKIRAGTESARADELCDITIDDSAVREQVESSNALPDNITVDSKYDKLMEILNAVSRDEPAAKVLIFSFFVGTVEYLQRRLSEAGITTVAIHGEIPSTPLKPQSDERGKRIARFRDDAGCRVLISTEVGSEGLDFQFCHHLVNYDLPWNPMVVEQRIGRIDRFGQQQDAINVYNLVVSGTVEDTVLNRLYERIGIFEHSLGELETILGDTMRGLQRDYVNGNLTPEEAKQRADQAAYAIENRQSHIRHLESQAEELFGLEEYVRAELNRVDRLGRFLTDRSLMSVVASYLASEHPEAGLWADQGRTHCLRLTKRLRTDIRGTVPGRHWVDRSQGDRLRITTDGDEAFRNPRLELINAAHPLVVLATEKLRTQLEQPAARAGKARLEFDIHDHPEFAAGMYAIVVYAQEVSGLRARRVLTPIALRLGAPGFLESEMGERLLHLVGERGEDWLESVREPAIPAECWADIVSLVRQASRELRKREERESEVQYQRRRRTIMAEYQWNRNERQKRLETAENRGRSESIIRAFRGQLQRTDAEHQACLEKLDTNRNTSVRFEGPIAACVVHVRHMSGLEVVDG